MVALRHLSEAQASGLNDLYRICMYTTHDKRVRAGVQRLADLISDHIAIVKPLPVPQKEKPQPSILSTIYKVLDNATSKSS